MRHFQFIRFGLLLGLLGAATLLAERPAWPRESDPLPHAAEASLQTSIQDLQKSEQLELEDTRQRLTALETEADVIRGEMQTYRIQSAIHANLLLTTQSPLEDLEEALRGNQRAQNRVAARLREVQSQRAADEVRLDQTRERIAIAEREAVRLRGNQDTATACRRASSPLRRSCKASLSKSRSALAVS